MNKDIMFFDCNVRLGRANHPDNSRLYEPRHILDEMDYCGIDRALVYHKEAMINPVSGNKLLIDSIGGEKRFVGCAVLVPSYTGELGDADGYVDFLVAGGIRAVRFFPRVNSFSLKPYAMEGILQAAERHKLPVIIDYVHDDIAEPYSTWDHCQDYDAIYELCTVFGNLNYIIVLPGMRSQRYLYPVMSKCSNVYVEVSSFGYKNIEDICAKFGAERLVFGTYTPVAEAGALVGYLMYADISDCCKELIAGRNLQRLIGEVVI